MPAPAAQSPGSPSGARRAGWFGAGFAAATAVFVAYQLFFAPPPAVRVAALPRPTLAPLTVQVSGAVVAPGVYALTGQARVEDAVKAAGGVTEEADGEALNLAAKLSDGQRVVVPRRGAGSQAPATASTDGSQSTAVRSAGAVAGRVNLNTASLADLDALPGVGQVTAQKIVEQRQKATFTSVDQLLELKLVNSAVFARIKDLVTVD